ncbi:putative NADH-ubiquinone oxidoreductase [Ophiocordyceps camponoti-floridani]|uniref:Putative NADH-ubiquinone oxidoreductase n=1 Tax=Ophiocordyceps camponoti-floridani TaxID=2030778 RepID=A0A8H4VDD2_9HYPO|nr:putative NADH-ubiquinone oxidoreductase [Ophiocordyceps camponoti-floridani]
MGLVEQMKPTGGSADDREARFTRTGNQVTVNRGEWQGPRNVEAKLEHIKVADLEIDHMRLPETGPMEDYDSRKSEDEPQLTVEQIAELEKRIGAGLIEEVIQVAEAELRLVEIMQEASVWSTLKNG